MGRGDRPYVVQIDRGGPAGEATFRWSRSWKGGFDSDVRVRQWQAKSVPVPGLGADRRSPPVALEDGISVWFCAREDGGFEKDQTFHFNVYDAMNEVVWGEVYVPPDTPPGHYQGELTLTFAGHEPVVIPVDLEVWGFDVPRERSVVTAYNGWMVPGFYEDCPDADWLFETLQHQHRLDLQTIHGHRTPWRGRYDAMDWSAFDAAAEKRLDGSAYPDRAPLKRFHLGMYGCGNEWHWTKAAAESVTNVTAYSRAFAAHLKEKGWFDRVYMYCRDEPRADMIPAIIRDIRAFIAGDPDWRGKFMVTSRPTPDSPLLDWIDIWCVKYHWWIDVELRQSLRDRGKTFWCYVANTPHSPNPTYHLDSLQGYEPRLIKWAAWAMDAKGFLYWATALDQEYPNPWTTAMNDFGACGDANLIYYGARNGPRLTDNATPLRPIMGPLPGYRLKQIREGFEDWEYLLLCEKLKGRAFTADLVSQVYRSPGGAYGEYKEPRELEGAWTQDPNRIYEVRRRVAEVLLDGRRNARP
jgi:hypothetical protein